MSGNNYNTKFRLGQLVQVTSGLHKGTEGIIKAYFPESTQGLLTDNLIRGIHRTGGTYRINEGGWLTPDIIVEEEALEAV